MSVRPHRMWICYRKVWTGQFPACSQVVIQALVGISLHFYLLALKIPSLPALAADWELQWMCLDVSFLAIPSTWQWSLSSPLQGQLHSATRLRWMPLENAQMLQNCLLCWLHVLLNSERSSKRNAVFKVDNLTQTFQNCSTLHVCRCYDGTSFISSDVFYCAFEWLPWMSGHWRVQSASLCVLEFQVVASQSVARLCKTWTS